MCSLLAARNRPREEERFLMSVFIGRSAGVVRVSATSEQMCNWCWDSPGVPHGKHPLSLFYLISFFFFFCGMAPYTPSPHHRGRHRVKNGKTKKKKKRQMWSQEEDTLQFWALFSLSGSVSLLPAGVIALPTRRGAGIWRREVGGGDVPGMSPFVYRFAWMLLQNGR